MMADPLFELQRALYACLSTDAAVSAMVSGRVFDRVPADAQAPYISFGPMTADDDGADCIDGLSVSVQIDAWSQAVGYGEVKEIAGAVRKAIAAADLALNTHALADITHRSTRILRDPDGLTSHAVLTFEASIEAL